MAPEHGSRRHIRYRDKLLVSFASPTRSGHVYVDNLSVGGMFIEMNEPLAPESPVHLAIFLDFGDEARKVQLSAEVAWSRPGEGMGLRFVAVSDKAAEQIRLAIERLAQAS